jgi:hypothetical protein
MKVACTDFLGDYFKWFYLPMYFHGARFSNYEAWLSDPIHIKPSAQIVWPVVGQEILNGDVGGGFQGIQITSGFFQLWRASGITSELQLYSTAIGGLVMAAAMFFAGWFHYHKAAPKLEWFQNVESMLNHHLAGLLGLGSLAWAGHQIHVSLPVNKLLDAGVDPKEIPLPHDFLLNRQIMADLYPSFSKGLAPFFTLQWNEYSDFLTFNGGLNPVTGGLWLSDTAHHHVAIAVLFLVAGHMYRTNWGIGHSMKEILEAHKGPFTGEGHVGLYEILTTSWHAQLAINLALFGSLSIIVAWSSWVTLNPTICWNTPFSLFERLPQVLGFSFLSVFFNFVESSKDFSTNSWLNGFKIFCRKPTEKSSRKEQSAGNESIGFRILRDFTWDIRFFEKNFNTVAHFGLAAESHKRRPYDFSNFQKHSQKHARLSSEKQAFLEWFLGFAEGDGSFGVYNGRLNFVINQAEIEILKKIRSELGFGNVSTFRQNERVYARYSVTAKHGLFCLIHLFNGNLHLQKVQTRFIHWVTRFNESKTYSEYEKILLLPRLSHTELSCENGWLSGFFDAEGGFTANITQPSEEPKRYFRLRLKAYVDQKDEFEILNQIASLFQVKNVTTRNVKKKTYRVDCVSKKSLELVLQYFSRYPLRSKKHLVYAMWKKITSAYLQDSHLQNIPQLERRVLRIRNQNKIFKELKTVLSQ